MRSAFDWLQHKHDNKYFENLKDRDKEKAIMLDDYGLKPEDEEAKQVHR